MEGLIYSVLGLKPTANPIVDLSGVFGTNVIALGHDLSYDTIAGELTKFNAGLNFFKDDLVASSVLNEKVTKAKWQSS